MGRWTSDKPPAPYKFCWRCSRQLYAGGRSYEVIRIDGLDRYVHADCARILKEEAGE